MVKYKKLKIAVLALMVAFSLICFIGLKFKPLGRRLISTTMYYHGDLFEMAKVWRFKDKIPINHKELKTKNIDDADIIAMGDSFMEANYVTPTLPVMLQDKTHKNVYHVDRGEYQNCGDNPLAYLDKIHYKAGRAKYLVVDVVERYAMTTCTNYQFETYKQYAAYNASLNPPAAKPAVTDKVKSFVSTPDLQYLFYNNWAITPFYELGKNFRFETMREIDPRTPVYSKAPAMLFFNEDVAFVNSRIDKKYIDMMAYNVNMVKEKVKKKYGLDLIYVVQPTKYSIYGKYDKNFKGYNNFIPEFYASMEKYGIKTFDTYSLYMNAGDIDQKLLYYKSDTHFTPRGKELVVEKIGELVQ